MLRIRVWGGEVEKHTRGVRGVRGGSLLSLSHELQCKSGGKKQTVVQPQPPSFLQPKINQTTTIFKIRGGSHIPGVLDNHDLTEKIQHALNINTTYTKKELSEEGGGEGVCVGGVIIMGLSYNK